MRSIFRSFIIISFCCLPLLASSQSGLPGPKTILILGNSIVQHDPAPDIGWNGNWGMAASAADSDFVHRLIGHIREKDASVAVHYYNIADYEHNYTDYSLSLFDTLKGPDILIVKLSENVDDYNSLQYNFISHYKQLIDYLSTPKTTRIIVDGFWKKNHVNHLLSNYAAYYHCPFVSITGLSDDSTNTALHVFNNPGVAIHPSDKGMRLIADAVWAVLSTFL